jgi:hypothetical protein
MGLRDQKRLPRGHIVKAKLKHSIGSQHYLCGLPGRLPMDTHDLKSLVIPLVAAIGLTILGVLVAVYLGFAWD